ncbi:MAG: pyridoxal phosphate-dependent aminotransferase [Rhodospirillales bacterium]|nr:pyridoxal phosphate-dependent aminotransferase [Rhodospirillales bacterium]MBO6786590.1 pyridoxal phosphate-dependent aminotransferase [Rhodospirillales bacterium]
MPPRFTDLVKTLPESVPFVGPETHERQRGKPFIARIGANESVFGPSPKAVKAMCAAAEDVWKYCDAESYELKHALAAHHDVAAENIVIGEGIDGLLGLVVRMLVEQADTVITSAGAYPTFNYHVTGFGGELIKVPYAGDYEDPDALLDAARAHDAKLVYIANPDNPMGTAHNADVIARMIAESPENTVLCLDEAYAEFADPDIAPPLDTNVPNVIRFRTFSKAYGMAGARIGYAIASPELARAFDKVRNHFGVNKIAQEGARAALEDQAYLADVQANVIAARARIKAIAADNGLSVVPSQTNFVAVDCGRDGDFAKRVLSHLVEQGVFVRMPGVPPLDRCIRVSAGTDADLDAFAAELPKALYAAADPG